mmetsp:Transcript_53925/g.96039  ORF Transcript_53925/g.96039 Transcript_53925/m.96039 type:complete len:104 (-) Transcript_53925:764-1075(-)
MENIAKSSRKPHEELEDLVVADLEHVGGQGEVVPDVVLGLQPDDLLEHHQGVLAVVGRRVDHSTPLQPTGKRTARMAGTLARRIAGPGQGVTFIYSLDLTRSP